jgi:hypothetical protein
MSKAKVMTDSQFSARFGFAPDYDETPLSEGMHNVSLSAHYDMGDTPAEGVALWTIDPLHAGEREPTLCELREMTNRDNETNRQANLARYIRQGFAFESPSQEGLDNSDE